MSSGCSTRGPIDPKRPANPLWRVRRTKPVQIYVPLGGRLYLLSESLDPAEMIEAGGQGYEGERVVTWPLGGRADLDRSESRGG